MSATMSKTKASALNLADLLVSALKKAKTPNVHHWGLRWVDGPDGKEVELKPAGTCLVIENPDDSHVFAEFSFDSTGKLLSAGVYDFSDEWEEED